MNRLVGISVIAAVLLTGPAPVAVGAEIGPGEGLVIFTRDDKFAGKAIRFNITVNGAPTLQLLAGTTIEHPMPVGTHTFSVYTPSLDGQDHITINVQEGWTYRVEGHIRWGYPAGRAKFKLVSETGPGPSSSTSSAQPTSSDTEALAGPALGQVTARTSSATQPNRSAEESGRIALRNFVGDWNLETWSLADDGSKLEGSGTAEGSAESNSAVRIYINDFNAPDFPAAKGGGQVRIAYEEGKGFVLETHFAHSNETLRFSGRYEADAGRHVFFLIGSQGETATGIARVSTRVEIRSLDLSTWVADTYASIDRQTVHVQSYRFSRRQ